MDPLTIIPAFSYSYQCGSTLLVAYIPVYLYSASFQFIWTILKLFFLLIRNPKWLIDRLRKWSPIIFDPAFVAPESCSRIIEPHQIISNMMNNVILLLSFGLCCPLLELFVTLNICLFSASWMYFLGRFVYWNCEESRSTTEEVESPISLEKDKKEFDDMKCLGRRSIQHEDILIQLNQQVLSVNTSILVCKWPIIVTSCLFVTLLSWDMAGDEVGWYGSLWVPGTGCLILIVIWMWDWFLLSSNWNHEITLNWIISDPKHSPPSPESIEMIHSSLHAATESQIPC